VSKRRQGLYAPGLYSSTAFSETGSHKPEVCQQKLCALKKLFLKITHYFFAYFDLNVYLKHVFKITAKCIDAPPKDCAQDCMPLASSLRQCLQYLVQYFKLAYVYCLYRLTSIFCNCANFNRLMHIKCNH